MPLSLVSSGIHGVKCWLTFTEGRFTVSLRVETLEVPHRSSPVSCLGAECRKLGAGPVVSVWTFLQPLQASGLTPHTAAPAGLESETLAPFLVNPEVSSQVQRYNRVF